jgi:predicted ATPase/DNA-binding CsgD family transcriptional regulator
MLTHTLTDRELEILRLIAEGLSNQEIARELVLAPETVKWYNKHIFSKLDVHNRTQAAARAKALGLLNPEFQIAASSSEPTTPRSNFPAQVTTFIGRRSEVATIRQLLERSRLLTLTGIGGSGKTRLALQVAEELLGDFSDGAYFVPLAPVGTPDHILWAIVEHLNIQIELHGEVLAQLLSYFRTKTLLLVLDNFDHLVNGAGLLIELLQAAPALKIIATSRERLALYGEVNYPVTGMALPEADSYEETAQSESVQLFLERAQSVTPNLDWRPDDLQPVIRICQLVDGMPLGIELAATWVDTLSPQEIADEIEQNLDILETHRQDIPDSQRSIRAAFDRSWNLLDETQRTAFRRLSVFRGGFMREAGEVVTGVTLRTLQALVSKSLLWRNPDTGRYQFHELLRHYANEQFEVSGEATLINPLHAAYFADFLAERWHWMKDHRQKIALQEMESDLENARAAWQFWIKAGDVTQLIKFLHSFWVVYDIRGWYPAGIGLFEQAISVMHAVGTEEARAAHGWLLTVQGLYSVAGGYGLTTKMPAPSWMAGHGVYSVEGTDVRHGFTVVQEGVRILRQHCKSDEMMILPLISLFITACLLDEEGVPLQSAQECLEIATKMDDTWAIAKATQFLAVRAIEEGEYEQGSRLAHEALAAFEANGDNWSKSIVCIEVLGLLAITLREFDNAKAWIQKGLAAAEEIGFIYAIQTAYWQMGFVASLEGNYSEAGLWWRKAIGIADGALGSASVIGFGGSSRVTQWGGRKLIKD